MPRRRLRVAALLLASACGGLAFVLPVTPAFAASTVTNACLSNATATYSDIAITMSGTAPDSVNAGDAVTLTGASFQAAVPATLLIAGYNLGLLTVGVNDIPVKWWVARTASNTVEGQDVQNGTLSVATTISDPDGTPGTGDEGATPLDVSVPLADWTVTANGDVEFRQGGSIPTIPAGVAAPGAVTPAGSVFFSASVAGGLIRANFDCRPGTSSADGATFTPATASPFETVTVVGGSTTTSTTTTSTTTTTTSIATTTTAPTSTTTTTIPPGATSVTGTRAYAATCTNSVTPDKSTLTFTITGTVPTRVQAGSTVTLSQQSWRVDVPGSVLDAGIGLALIQPGDTVQGTVKAGVFATNTVEGTRTSGDIAVAIGPIAVDGAGKAQPAATTLAVPDMTWTAVGGDIGLEMARTTVLVSIGVLKVTFTCDPATTGQAFVTAPAVGQSNLTAAPRPQVLSAETTQTTATDLARTGWSPLKLALLGLALLDLGYLLWSSSVPGTRRRSTRRTSVV